jgi:hypothetical protein
MRDSLSSAIAASLQPAKLQHVLHAFEGTDSHMILFNSEFWCVVMLIRIPKILVTKLDSFTNIVDLGFFVDS